jgi:hypothetical protein
MSFRRRAHRYGRGPLVIALLAVAAIIATAVIAFAILRGPAHSVAGTKATPSALPTCASSGCAVVSLSRTLPPITVFYGASCSGVFGSWFFNAVEAGSGDELSPSYSVKWSFAPGSVVAKPSGRIVIPPTTSTQVTLTLVDGALSLSGTRKPNTRVTATGTLVVELSGSATAPELKFTEAGLTKAESSLGLVSPFNVGGSPLTVPVKTVKTMSGC